MNKARKTISIILLLCLLLADTLVFNVEARAETGQVWYVENKTTDGNNNNGGSGTSSDPYKQLTTAIDRAGDGDTIVIRNRAYVNSIDENGKKPFIIDKSLIIKSENPNDYATLYSRRGGIIIEKDVEFENIRFQIANGSNTNIYANGNSLWLNNCIYTDGFKPHIFAGGYTAQNEFYSGHVGSAVGNNASIRISGKTNLGNIYAGGLYEGYEGNVSIVYDSDVTTYGNSQEKSEIYGTGAIPGVYNSQNFFDTNNKPEPPVPSLSYTVNGMVSATISYTRTSKVEGVSGTPLCILYNDTKGYTYSPILKNVFSVSVEQGDLAPAGDSNILSGGAISISDGAKFNIQNISNFSIDTLVGGGTIILGKDQTLNITGSISNTTKVGIGSINYNNETTVAVSVPHTYISAPNSNNNSFSFLPLYSSLNQSNVSFERDTNGNWISKYTNAEIEEEIVRVSSVNPQNKTVYLDASDIYMSIPLNPTFPTEDGYGYLDTVKMGGVSLNGSSMRIYIDEDGYYLYKSYGEMLEIVNNTISLTKSNGSLLDAGVYRISFFIPKANTSTGSNINVSVTLTVKNSADSNSGNPGGDTGVSPSPSTLPSGDPNPSGSPSPDPSQTPSVTPGTPVPDPTTAPVPSTPPAAVVSPSSTPSASPTPSPTPSGAIQKSLYTITFDGNKSNSGKMSAMNGCEVGKEYSLSSNQFKRNGYSFAGWNTRADGNGIAYANNATVSNLATSNGATIKLYAQWKKTSYKISYNLNKGKNNKKNPTKFTITTKTIKLKAPTRKGYKFVGWYTNKKCTGKKFTQIKKGTYKNIKLYAKWKKV